MMSPVTWLYHLWDTIDYIRTYGWSEWRTARERYDKHQEAIKNIKSRFNKRDYIKQQNALKKARR